MNVDFDNFRRMMCDNTNQLKEELTYLLNVGGNEEDVKEAFDSLSCDVGTLLCFSAPGTENFSDMTDNIDDLKRFCDEDEEE